MSRLQNPLRAKSRVLGLHPNQAVLPRPALELGLVQAVLGTGPVQVGEDLVGVPVAEDGDAGSIHHVAECALSA